MVNDADGVIYVKLTVKIVNYAVNRQSSVTVTIYGIRYTIVYGIRSLFTVPFLNDAVCAQHCFFYLPHRRGNGIPHGIQLLPSQHPIPVNVICKELSTQEFLGQLRQLVHLKVQSEQRSVCVCVCAVYSERRSARSTD